VNEKGEWVWRGIVSPGYITLDHKLDRTGVCLEARNYHDSLGDCNGECFREEDVRLMEPKSEAAVQLNDKTLKAQWAEYDLKYKNATNRSSIQGLRVLVLCGITLHGGSAGGKASKKTTKTATTDALTGILSIIIQNDKKKKDGAIKDNGLLAEWASRVSAGEWTDLSKAPPDILQSAAVVKGTAKGRSAALEVEQEDKTEINDKRSETNGGAKEGKKDKEKENETERGGHTSPQKNPPIQYTCNFPPEYGVPGISSRFGSHKTFRELKEQLMACINLPPTKAEHFTLFCDTGSERVECDPEAAIRVLDLQLLGLDLSELSVDLTLRLHANTDTEAKMRIKMRDWADMTLENLDQRIRKEHPSMKSFGRHGRAFFLKVDGHERAQSFVDTTEPIDVWLPSTAPPAPRPPPARTGPVIRTTLPGRTSADDAFDETEEKPEKDRDKDKDKSLLLKKLLALLD